LFNILGHGDVNRPDDVIPIKGEASIEWAIPFRGITEGGNKVFSMILAFELDAKVVND
jgi:hypothetical protein